MVDGGIDIVLLVFEVWIVDCVVVGLYVVFLLEVVVLGGGFEDLVFLLEFGVVVLG